MSGDMSNCAERSAWFFSFLFHSLRGILIVSRRETKRRDVKYYKIRVKSSARNLVGEGGGAFNCVGFRLRNSLGCQVVLRPNSYTATFDFFVYELSRLYERIPASVLLAAEFIREFVDEINFFSLRSRSEANFSIWFANVVRIRSVSFFFFFFFQMLKMLEFFGFFFFMKSMFCMGYLMLEWIFGVFPGSRLSGRCFLRVCKLENFLENLGSSGKKFVQKFKSNTYCGLMSKSYLCRLSCSWNMKLLLENLTGYCTKFIIKIVYGAAKKIVWKNSIHADCKVAGCGKFPNNINF